MKPVGDFACLKGCKRLVDRINELCNEKNNAPIMIGITINKVTIPFLSQIDFTNSLLRYMLFATIPPSEAMIANTMTIIEIITGIL